MNMFSHIYKPFLPRWHRFQVIHVETDTTIYDHALNPTKENSQQFLGWYVMFFQVISAF